ncbi:type II secretion system protein [Microcoleus sp. MOSTC5]|uniref:type II secretion system protein n=1 Tax=Microcoleus sp. MOSTC5 TaxID=3055378 RepID=UPI002FCE9E83
MKLTELLTSMTILSLLTTFAVPTTLRIIANAKVTGALLQLHQTAKQSRYDAIINYGQVRSVAIFAGENPGIAECLDGICGKPMPMPKGIVIKSTFRGIDAKVAGKDGADRATLVSWSSETNAGIGGSYGQHGSITFSHPWSLKKFCLVRGGAFGNEGEYAIRKDKECK